MVTRREFLIGSGAAFVAGGLPSLTLARAATEARLVVIVLRGALDGLAAVPAYGDGNYRQVRGALALDAPGSTGGTLDLGGLFALHPNLERLHDLYREHQLLVCHAVATPYRERSHFDGQKLLENGTARPAGARDGWLNRALAVMAQQRPGSAELGMALGQNVPLVLRGEQQVASWAPSRLPDADEETLQRIADMYAGNEYFASRLAQALAANEIAAAAMGGQSGRRRRGGQEAQFIALVQAAGKFLQVPEGPRVAVFETGGWDTHANQGGRTGALANRLGALDRGIGELQASLGEVWDDTAVLIVTEFGRTVAVNGTRGTDHGIAGCAFLAGGAVDGGRVVADWPGLAPSDLYEGRDLRPTMDLRSVCKDVLHHHLGIAESALETTVFPDSRGASPTEGLIRT